MANNAELWERLPQESMKAYAAFCAYRDLGPDRSMAKAGEVLGKSQGLMEGWSAAYDWVKRATAWDDEQDRVARKAQMDEIKKMRVRHAKIAQKALDKVSAALDKVNPDAMTNADMARPRIQSRSTFRRTGAINRNNYSPAHPCTTGRRGGAFIRWCSSDGRAMAL